MTDSKFTPGPWLAASHPSSVVGWPVVKCGEGGGRSICSVSYLPSNDEVMAESKANSLLIAAAPDLYAACYDWIAWLDSDGWREDAAAHESRILDVMRAALGKTRGDA